MQNNPVLEERYANFGTTNTIIKKSKQFHREQILGNTSQENSMLMIVAGVEKVCTLDSIFNYYESSKVIDKDLWLYPNAWHFIYMEEEIYDIMPRINNWIKDRL